MGYDEIFLPLKGAGGYKSVYLELSVGQKRPFFSLLDDMGTVKNFLYALQHTPEEAGKYLSRRLKAAETIDLERLVMYLNQAEKLKLLNGTGSVDFKRDSVLVIGDGINLLHLHLIREPDHNGFWKIYGVERE